MSRNSILAALVVLATCMGALTAPAAAQSPHTHEHSFGDAEKWAQVFDDPEARRVAEAARGDPGAGAEARCGHRRHRRRHRLLLGALRAHGAKGRVYGVDTEPDMVKYLAERAKREGLKNLIAVAGQPGRSAPARESGPDRAGRRLSPRRGARALFPQAAGLAQSRRPHCDHRLSPGLAGRPAEERAHRRRTA